MTTNKRGPGRPASGTAKSNAERQKAFREQKAQEQGETLAYIEQLRRGFHVEYKRARGRTWRKWSGVHALSLDAAESMIRGLKGAEPAAEAAGLGGNTYRIVPA